MSAVEAVENAIVTDLDEETYHRHPALSSTGAKRILESPAIFRHQQLYPQPPKEAFDLGHAVHAMVLGIGAPIVEIPDEILASNGAISTKEAKQFVADARSEGKVPLKSDVYFRVRLAVDSVLGHPTARAFLEQDGTPETSVFAVDPEFGVNVRCRFDKLAPVAVDLKTTSVTANPDAFGRVAVNLGYDVQQEFYLDTYEWVTGERLDFVFIAVELDAPNLVSVNQLDKQFRDMGRAKAREARRRFAECVESGEWPGYPSDVNLVSPPRWAVREFEEKYA